jgi:hypothetical protein
VVPSGSVPTLGQLEARIDEALVIARASEEGLREVGEMALDAARQARRAAEAAENSARSAAAVAATTASEGGGASERVAEPEQPPQQPEVEVSAEPKAPREPASPPKPRFEVRFRSFNERADRVAARLRALQGHGPEPATATFPAARRRGDD